MVLVRKTGLRLRFMDIRTSLDRYNDGCNLRVSRMRPKEAAKRRAMRAWHTTVAGPRLFCPSAVELTGAWPIHMR
jgi:hypothetical protein